MQSTVLDTLLRLIETASGTNRLSDGDHAMARDRGEEKRGGRRGEGKEGGEKEREARVSKIGQKTKWHS